jgi:hypothetical protein
MISVEKIPIRRQRNDAQQYDMEDHMNIRPLTHRPSPSLPIEALSLIFP